MDLENVVRRVRGEFMEMPGLRLTPAQAMRLWGLERETCAARHRRTGRRGVPEVDAPRNDRAGGRIAITVRLKPDTTSITVTVRLTPDTTYGYGPVDAGRRARSRSRRSRTPRTWATIRPS